ncbi:MAG: Nod factor export ATP-binding protein [Pseudomonadota bacterium]|jgi:lipooligosaccharide transport system ATP-binding protein
MSVLSVNQLRKRYGEVDVVDGISFALQPGECFGLLGPNGAGKTTTLRLALGLIDPDGGDISLLHRPLPREGRPARLKVGVVPQMDSLDPDFSVEENLLVFGRYFGMPDKLIRERIPLLLEFAGLTQRAKSKTMTLSGGMKRRLTLARALINDPDLVFLDEPTTGLDPQARHVIWERLRKLLNQGKTILLTTHFMEEAERLCNRVMILDHGKAIAQGAPRDLIAQHIEPHVVEVYGDSVTDWVERSGKSMSERAEITGETAFCYAHDAKPLLDNLSAQNELRYLHRAANLEDVFLKLTGRELRD